MRNMLSALPLFLASSWALAANMEEAANAAPSELVSGWYVLLFLLLFVGMIVGFFAYLWWNEKHKAHDQ